MDWSGAESANTAVDANALLRALADDAFDGALVLYAPGGTSSPSAVVACSVPISEGSEAQGASKPL